MDLLDERKSWELFCKRVFGKDSCPRELEESGMKIAKHCGGLPLSISVIGGHLAASERTRKYWEHVADSSSSVVNSAYNEESLKILSLSYTNLPIHLKPCFLYMAIFSEDEEIEVHKLTTLWVAEGFIRPISGKSLEEAAEQYLIDLIGRSLILPSKTSRRGKLKRCKIHGLLRELCVKEAMENKFLYMALKLDDLRAIENERRIVRCHMESSEGAYSLPYYNVLRSRALRTFIFEGELSSLKDKKLLRVLAPVIGSSSFLFETLDTDQLVNIRYLDPSVPFFQDIYRPPPSMFLLWNLQYLSFDIRIDVEAPLEIWKMVQLRDVKIKEFSVSHPPSESKDIMKNLRSAQTLINFNFSEEAVERIPNIQKLKVRYDDRLVAPPDEILNGVVLLKKLESLGCSLDLSRAQHSHMLRNLHFPYSLRELNFSHLRWEDVTTKVGSLPLLEVLKLSRCEGSEWELVEGQFRKLKFLQLSHCLSLHYFAAEDTHFPCLESLVLERMDKLDGIASDFAQLPMLKSIELNCCPDSAVMSASEIADISLRDVGPEWLQVKVRLLKESKHLASLGTDNFHIQ